MEDEEEEEEGRKIPFMREGIGAEGAAAGREETVLLTLMKSGSLRAEFIQVRNCSGSRVSYLFT